MKIYHYDKDTGVFISEAHARRDPLEEEERHLVPAHATTVAPPEPREGQVPVWDGKRWSFVDDRRGPVWDAETHAQLVWDKLGPLPELYASTAPPSPRHRWDGLKWKIPLTESVTRKKAEIREGLENRLEIGFTWRNRIWQATPKSQAALAGIAAANCAGLAPSPLPWRDASDTRVELDGKDVIELNAAMAEFVNACHQAAFDDKDVVDEIAADASLSEAAKVQEIEGMVPR